MRECIPPNLHNPQRAKGFLDRRSKRLSFPHFFLRRKKCGRRRPPPRQGKANSPPQRRKRALFVSDGDSFAPRRELLLSAVTKVAKSTGRNCVSALPQRAMPGSDLLRILAGITFHHRCQSKGLCLRSPARRLTRPLASATVGVFLSYRHPPKPSPRVAHPPKAFPLGGVAVLNDTPVACQIRGPTDPQGDRCPHIPAALAATYPLRCFAPQWARFDNRHSISAPAPILSLHQRQRRKWYKRSLNRQRPPPSQFREASTAKFALACPAPRDP